MMRILLLVSVLAVTSMTAYSQNFDADINILLGMPQSDFRETLDRNALGLNGSIAFRIPRLPVYGGLELGIMTYGRDRRREQLSPTIPEIQLEVRTDYDIFTGHLFARLEPDIRGIRPYIDGLVGIKYLFTESSIRDDDGIGEDIASTTNYDDSSFSYGAGGGIKFEVYDGGRDSYMVNLKARYLIGAEASYLQPGSIDTDRNGNLIFDESRSGTNLLTIHLGMSYKF